jgi:hypothetical protein
MAWMSAAGTFLYFAAINFFGFLILSRYVKETQGLNDKQKKRIYIPKSILKMTVEGSASDRGGEIQIDTIEQDTGHDIRPENFETEEHAHKLELEEQEQAENSEDYQPVEQETNRTEVVGLAHSPEVEIDGLEMEEEN